ncbi:2-aminoethylphosphonate--pyruvate transaminase [Stenoxybacter acetivorans]|uniref:2-aminoethylphosphonate--pyruvate transaminase n=1 Tax=Stenoxybacter acetivorans TaxID=422441 RepID=UPI00056116F2|nr:2-aminoethylphosphonate--pyruvate transaminase [Stenoxybacter acetivorans]
MPDYKLLTPGPLTTSATVKQAMLTDHCTWDDDYKHITQDIRAALLRLGEVAEPNYTAVLMQGSGSFAVEAVISSTLTPQHQALVLINGAYGERIAAMLARADVPHIRYDETYNRTFCKTAIHTHLNEHPNISHIIMVHCETTTGILNDIAAVGEIAAEYGKIFIVDAMSSFGGIAIPIADWHIDFLISSANKCIQGVPGFAFVLAKTARLQETQGRARTLSLDLFDQWQAMQKDGKWRFTSPTHTVLAFAQALCELEQEGGVNGRYLRYLQNNCLLREKLAALGVHAYIDHLRQSPFITTFLFPDNPAFCFADMYQYVKQRGYALYPGKLTDADTFRIGNIGEIFESDIEKVCQAIGDYLASIQQ